MSRKASVLRSVRLGVAGWIGVTLAAVLASQPVAAQTVEACGVAQGQFATPEDATNYMKAFFRGLFRLRSDSTADGEPGADLYFTNVSGLSSRPRCKKGQAAAIGRFDHLYYPIGLVVRKLGEVKLGKDPYWLVETEYGLKTYIGRPHLTAIEPDVAFLFANGTQAPKGYCLGQKDEPCTPDSYIEGRRIDPQTRYARATLADFEASGHRPAEKNYIGSAADLPCGIVKVGIYGRIHRKDPEPVWQEGVRLNTCVDQGIPINGNARMVSSGFRIFDPNVKVVLRRNYEDYFKKRIDASLLRVEPGFLSSLAPEFETRKRCNQVLKFESATKYNLEGGAGAKFLSVLEIGGDAAKNYMRSFQEQVGSDVAIFLLAYDLTTEASAEPVQGAPIQIRFGCDGRNSAPQQAYEIRVFHPSSSTANDFVIGFKTVSGDAPRDDALTISAQDKSPLFDQGYVFLVRGPADYFPVRDKIFGLLRLFYRDKLQELYSDPDDELYFHRLASFVTHLIIAAAGKAAAN